MFHRIVSHMDTQIAHRLRSLSGVCAHFGLNRNLISAAATAGELPYVRQHDAGQRYFDDVDVVAWIESRKVRSGLA